MLHKFKQKAWHTAVNIKSSISTTSGLAELFLDGISGKSGSGSSSPKHMRKAKSSYNPAILDALKSEMEDGDLARHTINEAKLAKLHSILSVLRDKEETSSGAETPPIIERKKLPEFLSIFDTGNANANMENANTNTGSANASTRNARANTKTLPSRTKKKKKRNKLSEALLHVLHEDKANVSSDSGDNLEELPATPLNKQSTAWLRSRKLDPNYRQWETMDDDRRRSDSFQSIPRLRESLNAGKRNKVSTYSFDDHSPGKKQPTSGAAVIPRDAPKRNRATISCDDSREQLHYTVMDTKSLTEEELSSQDGKFSSPVCKYYSVPVEVSVHRISVQDVDKPAEMEIGRTKSFDVNRNRDKSTRDTVSFPDTKKSLREKPRSHSVGDVDMLESDDEVLLVRAPPVTGHSPASGRSPAVERRSEEKRSEQNPPSPARELSSLDFTIARESGEDWEERHSKSFNSRDEGKDGDVNLEWAPQGFKGQGGGGKSSSLPTSRSLDDLVDAVPRIKSKYVCHYAGAPKGCGQT